MGMRKMAKIGAGREAAGKGGGGGGTRQSGVRKATAKGSGVRKAKVGNSAKPPREQCFARCIKCGRKFPVPGNCYCSECESELNEAKRKR